MLSEELIRKIALYNIHPVANILKPIIKTYNSISNIMVININFGIYLLTNRIGVHGCYNCHKLVDKLYEINRKRICLKQKFVVKKCEKEYQYLRWEKEFCRLRI